MKSTAANPIRKSYEKVAADLQATLALIATLETGSYTRFRMFAELMNTFYLAKTSKEQLDAIERVRGGVQAVLDEKASAVDHGAIGEG